MSESRRITLEMKGEALAMFQALSQRLGGPESEVFRKALTLLHVALFEGEDRGRALCLVPADAVPVIATRIVGLEDES